MPVDMSQCRLPPFQHQIEAVEHMLAHPYSGNFSEMGMGKSKIVIDAAQIMYHAGVIDRMVVVAPASVRSGVWYDPELSELAKHLWLNTPAVITEYHSKIRKWTHGPASPTPFRIVCCNFEFLRNKDRLAFLKAHCGPKTLLVLDEASLIKSWKAQQTKACESLRSVCGRIVILNGTPVSHSPGDLYSQAHIMHPSILDCKTWYHFRARYGVMGGYMSKVIVKWVNLEDLQRRLAPYVIRELKINRLDLPEKMPPVAITVPLTSASWAAYRELRDDLVLELQTGVVTAVQAAVKVIRLSQITSGFVGGIEEDGNPLRGIKTLSSEKLDMLISWLQERISDDPLFKCLVWSRHRYEIAVALPRLQQLPGVCVGEIRGDQTPEERGYALRLLDPRTTPNSPVVVIGTPASGSMGLNLTAAHTVVYISSDYNYKNRAQSEDRVHRTGQAHAVSYFDILCTGTQGQKTVDHAVANAIRNKQDLAEFTTSAWIHALTEE
jgi:hypothetical protein